MACLGMAIAAHAIALAAHAIPWRCMAVAAHVIALAAHGMPWKPFAWPLQPMPISSLNYCLEINFQIFPKHDLNFNNS
jgi:hypothetical protein